MTHQIPVFTGPVYPMKLGPSPDLIFVQKDQLSKVRGGQTGPHQGLTAFIPNLTQVAPPAEGRQITAPLREGPALSSRMSSFFSGNDSTKSQTPTLGDTLNNFSFKKNLNTKGYLKHHPRGEFGYLPPGNEFLQRLLFLKGV